MSVETASFRERADILVSPGYGSNVRNTDT